jgi:rod shape-determining protein MreC
MAEVTLVTDKDHAVPVKVERSGVRSVLFGAGAGRAPELRFMSPNADIVEGDVLVTSGIDGTYPPGLAVARVATLERETGQMFARITTRPVAGVDRSEYLLVLGHAAALPARPEEPAESDTAKKSGKGRRRGRARSRHGHVRVLGSNPKGARPPGRHSSLRSSPRRPVPASPGASMGAPCRALAFAAMARTGR